MFKVQILRVMSQIFLKLWIFLKFYQILPNVTKFLPHFTKFYQILPNFTKFYQILPNLTKFDQIWPNLTKFDQNWPNLTIFYLFTQHVKSIKTARNEFDFTNSNQCSTIYSLSYKFFMLVWIVWYSNIYQKVLSKFAKFSDLPLFF